MVGRGGEGGDGGEGMVVFELREGGGGGDGDASGIGRLRQWIDRTFYARVSSFERVRSIAFSLPMQTLRRFALSRR